MAFKFGIFLIGLAAAAIEKTPKFLNERKRAKIRKIKKILVKNRNRNFGPKKKPNFSSKIEI